MLEQRVLRRSHGDAFVPSPPRAREGKALRHRRYSLWLALGFETVFVKQWSGHSKASLLSDVYGHVMVDPNEDGMGLVLARGLPRSDAPKGRPSAFVVGPRWGQKRVCAAANGFVEPRRYFKKASGGRW